MAKIKDITGQKFGRLTAINFLERKKYRSTWEWQCDCGNLCYKTLESVKYENIKSCGCLSKEVGQKNKQSTILNNQKRGQIHRQKLIGQKFNKLLVIGHAPDNYTRHYMEFQCDCGNKVIKKHKAIVAGKIKSCGCIDNIKDLTGQRFERLIVIKFHKTYKNKAYWLCKCDCGTEKIIQGVVLTQKNTFSCGCLNKDRISEIGRAPKPKGQDSCHYKGYKLLSGRYYNSLHISAKKRDLIFDCSKEQIYSLIEKQKFKCALSNVDIVLSPSNTLKEHTASLDRIDSSKGYTMDNIQWIHKDLQSLKMDLKNPDYILWCHKISNYQKQQSQENIEYII